MDFFSKYKLTLLSALFAASIAVPAVGPVLVAESLAAAFLWAVGPFGVVFLLLRFVVLKRFETPWGLRSDGSEMDELLERAETAQNEEIVANLARRFEGQFTSLDVGVSGHLVFRGLPMKLELESTTSGIYRVALTVEGQFPHEFDASLSGLESRLELTCEPGEASEQLVVRLGGEHGLARRLADLELRSLGNEARLGLVARASWGEITSARIYRLLQGAAEIVRRLTSPHIGRKFLASELCPYCRDNFEGHEHAVAICSVCGTRHHRECWEENGATCAVFGCTSGYSLEDGAGEIRVRARTEVS